MTARRALAVLPPALARVQHGERRDTELRGERSGAVAATAQTIAIAEQPAQLQRVEAGERKIESRRCEDRPPGWEDPFAVARIDGEPVAFAGIWEEWRSPEGRSCGRSLCTAASVAGGRAAGLAGRQEGGQCQERGPGTYPTSPGEGVLAALDRRIRRNAALVRPLLLEQIRTSAPFLVRLPPPRRPEPRHKSLAFSGGHGA